MILFFLSSGLFLGWSLGANDAANVFGSAVGSRMVRFRMAALICSAFIIIGAVNGGSGPTDTLSHLGAVDALAGSFMVALAAAVTVLWMTQVGLPVSTSQAIVGAIIGWNFFTGHLTDSGSLRQIVLTWIFCPILAGSISALLYVLMRYFLPRSRIHLLRLDAYTRLGLILVGAFGAYSLGANNIANVMGVFVPAAPFPDFRVKGLLVFTSEQLLFMLGGFAIAAGVLSYSRRVIRTVGFSLMRLSPEMALIVVLAHSIVLFLFASEGLEEFLRVHQLPTLPLVPVSSSQAIVGAILGIGLIKGGKGIRYRLLAGISSGWVTTPICAGLLAFVSLFFLQNVFRLQVTLPDRYCLDDQVITRLDAEGLTDPGLVELSGREYDRAMQLDADLKSATRLDRQQRLEVVETAECVLFRLDPDLIRTTLEPEWFTLPQKAAVEKLAGREFHRAWEFLAALEQESPDWRLMPAVTKDEVKDLEAKRQFMLRTFRVRAGP